MNEVSAFILMTNESFIAYDKLYVFSILTTFIDVPVLLPTCKIKILLFSQGTYAKYSIAIIKISNMYKEFYMFLFSCLVVL